VAYRDASASGRGEVDIIDAHRKIADYAKPRQRANRGAVETIGYHAEHGIGLPRAREQFIGRRRHLVVPQVHAGYRRQPANCRLGDRPSDEYAPIARVVLVLCVLAVPVLFAAMLHPVTTFIASCIASWPVAWTRFKSRCAFAIGLVWTKLLPTG
jgi:hypothetical protein